MIYNDLYWSIMIYNDLYIGILMYGKAQSTDPQEQIPPKYFRHQRCRPRRCAGLIEGNMYSTENRGFYHPRQGSLKCVPSKPRRIHRKAEELVDIQKIPHQDGYLSFTLLFKDLPEKSWWLAVLFCFFNVFCHRATLLYINIYIYMIIYE